MERDSARARVPPGQGVTRGWPLLHVGVVPTTVTSSWRIAVGGEVEHELDYSWSEFLALPQVTLQADFHCVTGWSKLDNRWEGVHLRELARRAGMKASARFVRFVDPQDYDTSVPIDSALEQGLLAHRHDGQALPREHGGPLRGVVPGLYAWKSCKWVVRVEFMPTERLGFWELRGYHNDADPWKEERLV